MFQWYTKDFEMIITEKVKFSFDVLDHIYKYESKTERISLKQIKQRGHQMRICKSDSWNNVKKLKVMNGKKKMLKRKKKR